MFTSLRIQGFRSYQDDSFEFTPGVNIIVGPNASGKTNLLEALLVVARGGSYRGSDGELVGFGSEWARLDALLSDGREMVVKLLQTPRPGKVFDIDGHVYKRLSLEHSLPAVLFEPGHLELLAGSPEVRRNYLDDLLEQTTVGYGQIRQQYARTLRQRNALLKRAAGRRGGYAEASAAGGASTASGLAGQLFPWDVRLSQLAGQIVRARTDLVEQLDKRFTKLYRQLSHTKLDLKLNYTARFKPEHYETQLLHKLETVRDLDLARGFTAYGPHREDLEVLFDGHPASQTASRGETRTAVLALKIMELELLEAARGRRPILLLDDVFSELDGARRHALTEYLARYQTFITTTDADLLQKNFTSAARLIALTRR